MSTDPGSLPVKNQTDAFGIDPIRLLAVPEIRTWIAE
jgi:hypothetical protein